MKKGGRANLVKEALVTKLLQQLVLERVDEMRCGFSGKDEGGEVERGGQGNLFGGGEEGVGDVSVELVIIVGLVSFVDPLHAVDTSAEES
jgi:hypothetical protein